MAVYAADAQTTATPWTRWESCGAIGSWYGLKSHPAWSTDFEYRRKTNEAIMIGMLKRARDQLYDIQDGNGLNLDDAMELIHQVMKTLNAIDLLEKQV
jgi:hypothetical protein